MRTFKLFFLFLFFLPVFLIAAKVEIPVNEVLKVELLKKYLTEKSKLQINKGADISEAQLAAYFRQKFSERYFYDWHTFDARFELYNQLYSNQSEHKSRAIDHMQKFAANTQWVLPFNYLNGEKVNAYALRHLARQHKMVDIAFEYFYEKKDTTYLNYFSNQMLSLNIALKKGKYESIEDGNGVYEVFRSGYRTLNWLSIHNMFLGEKAYTDHAQLVTIATLLQHGANLYENNAQYQPGNHQTRGMSALAMISILLRDFKGTDLWYNRAMERLGEHLSKEVNNDGFQFERTVHYHISDIETYFYVYQLAKISTIEVNADWENKLKSLFVSLSKIAYPDGTAPVLQDDTDNTWAEKNDISGAMTLGYLLFNDPAFGYFADNKVDASVYWFLQQKQLSRLNAIEKSKPAYGSISLPDTRYYVMREGWAKNDKMMIVSAGLDPDKPDHQHADMLGVQAMANGQVILPNYQVSYPLTDFEMFKNSMVKNVALVDDELQGKDWTSNQGGSGFGKFKTLPHPTTICWKNNDNYDLFVGSHDGFQNVGVTYSRQVIYLKNDFWIIKDNFQSENKHIYKQVWQGHYTLENQPNLLRSTFSDASGSDIYQLVKVDTVANAGARGKQWSIVSKNNESNFNFVTVIYPFSGAGNRIDETFKNTVIKGWKMNCLPFIATGAQLRSLTKATKNYLFNVAKIAVNGVELEFSELTDVFVQLNNGNFVLQLLGAKKVQVKLSPNAIFKLNGQVVELSSGINTGDTLEYESR